MPLLCKSTYHHPVLRMKRRHASMGTGEEGQWMSKGPPALLDLEVVISVLRKFGKEQQVEVLSPEGNFVLYADSEEDWDTWTEAIQMKAQLFLFRLLVLVSSSLSSGLVCPLSDRASFLQPLIHHCRRCAPLLHQAVAEPAPARERRVVCVIFLHP
ncbi:hypothetical protein B0H14DRAFT_3462616 [Mycena olivaceomarginata]|nr:hypothetical protein B0H14DRAFT_3462616 [Mycena olivaceomarginata]